jgi:glycogenin glucosyltransferase
MVVMFPSTTSDEVIERVTSKMSDIVPYKIPKETDFDLVPNPLRPQLNKLNFLSLPGYRRTVWLDSDVLITRNMDGLCDPSVESPAMLAEVFGTGMVPPDPEKKVGIQNLFHTGLMVYDTHPQYTPILHRIVAKTEVVSYNQGDTGVLWNWVRVYHELPSHLMLFKWQANDLKSLPKGPYAPYTIHYLGKKPYACGRKEDCNDFMAFDSPFLHQLWWCMHDIAHRALVNQSLYVGDCATYLAQHITFKGAS